MCEGSGVELCRTDEEEEELEAREREREIPDPACGVAAALPARGGWSCEKKKKKIPEAQELFP